MQLQNLQLGSPHAMPVACSFKRSCHQALSSRQQFVLLHIPHPGRVPLPVLTPSFLTHVPNIIAIPTPLPPPDQLPL